jgi:G3E family GTPase
MTSVSDRPLVPVTLLTGFLGSGKTTLLNQLVQQQLMSDTLVIINEFGETALDHLLVTHSRENLIQEMSSGCLCCTIRGDLVKTLREISIKYFQDGERRFNRVLIETTGLADPAPIIHTLMVDPQVSNRYQLDGIVTTVDMATGQQTLDNHPEAIKQAAVADCLLLTKADLVSLEDQQALVDRLDVINPAATRYFVDQGQIEAEKLLNVGLFSTQGKAVDVERWLKEEAYRSSSEHGHHREHSDHDHKHSHGDMHHQHHHDVNRHDDHIRAFCFSRAEPIDEDDLNEWMELIMLMSGSNILRVKGILNIKDREQPMVIHGVQHIFHPPLLLPNWPDGNRHSRFVFITKHISQESIEKTFRALC